RQPKAAMPMTTSLPPGRKATLICRCWSTRKKNTLGSRSRINRSAIEKVRASCRRKRRHQAYFAIQHPRGHRPQPLQLLFTELSAMTGHRLLRLVEVSLRERNPDGEVLVLGNEQRRFPPLRIHGTHAFDRQTHVEEAVGHSWCACAQQLRRDSAHQPMV